MATKGDFVMAIFLAVAAAVVVAGCGDSVITDDPVDAGADCGPALLEAVRVPVPDAAVDATAVQDVCLDYCEVIQDCFFSGHPGYTNCTDGCCKQ